MIIYLYTQNQELDKDTNTIEELENLLEINV